MASSNSLLVFTALLGIILILSLEVVSAGELHQQTKEKVVETGYEEQKASAFVAFPDVLYGYNYQPVQANRYYNGFQPKENVDKAGYEGQKASVSVGLPGGNYNDYRYISVPAYGPYGTNSGAQPSVSAYVPYDPYGPNGLYSGVQQAGNYPGVIYSSSFYNSYPYVIGYGGQP